MNYRYNRFFAPMAFLLTGLLFGCSPHDASQIQQDTHQLAKDTGKAVGGVTLATKVNTALSMHKGVDMSGLHIDTTGDGTVTLGGHVRNEEEKKTVEETAKGVTGVNKVVNNLRVAP